MIKTLMYQIRLNYTLSLHKVQFKGSFASNLSANK